MKTVEQVLKEYRNRQAEPEIKSLVIFSAGVTRSYSDVTNLVERESWIEFDFPDYECCVLGDHTELVRTGYNHFGGWATILNKVVKIND